MHAMAFLSRTAMHAILKYSRMQDKVEPAVDRLSTAFQWRRGADLGTLYVTMARFRLPAERLAREPHASGLLALDVGARGLPEPMYAG
jgi:hypothetical protein